MGAHLRKKGPGLKATMSDIVKHLDGQAVVCGVLGRNDERSSAGAVLGVQAQAVDAIGNVELALIHEFGLGVPERSFLRRTFDKRREEWKALAARLLKLVSKGKLDRDAMLRLLGERMRSDVKREITSGAGIPPPNAPSTAAAKGSSRPLVDTGRLVGSIDYEVRSTKSG